MKKSLKHACVGFLLVIVLSSSIVIHPKKAEAIFGIGDVVFDPTNLIKNTITAAQSLMTAAGISSINIKETVLDPLAWSISQKMLQQMTADIVDWINSGFDGKPAFITDYREFFLDAMDRAAGEFLEDKLGGSCELFRGDIKAILTIELLEQRDFGRRSECKLSGAIAETRDFFKPSGGFASGGWKRWFEVTTIPSNNFIGALSQGQAALRDAQEKAEEDARTEAIAGNGMKSSKVCVDVPGLSQPKCSIVTPGSIISSIANKALGSGFDRLVQSDEMNEIISALYNQLATQAVTGVNGLLGLSFSDDGASQPFMQRFRDDITAQTGASSNNFLIDALRVQERYKKAHEDVLRIAEGVATSCDGGTGATELAKVVKQMNESIKKANQNIAAITQLQALFDAAPPEIKIAIAEEFQKMAGRGELPNEADLALRQLELDDIKSSLEELKKTCNPRKSTTEP